MLPTNCTRNPSANNQPTILALVLSTAAHNALFAWLKAINKLTSACKVIVLSPNLLPPAYSNGLVKSYSLPSSALTYISRNMLCQYVSSIEDIDRIDSVYLFDFALDIRCFAFAKWSQGLSIPLTLVESLPMPICTLAINHYLFRPYAYRDILKYIAYRFLRYPIQLSTYSLTSNPFPLPHICLKPSIFGEIIKLDATHGSSNSTPVPAHTITYVEGSESFLSSHSQILIRSFLARLFGSIDVKIIIKPRSNSVFFYSSGIPNCTLHKNCDVPFESIDHSDTVLITLASSCALQYNSLFCVSLAAIVLKALTHSRDVAAITSELQYVEQFKSPRLFVPNDETELQIVLSKLVCPS